MTGNNFESYGSHRAYIGLIAKRKRACRESSLIRGASDLLWIFVTLYFCQEPAESAMCILEKRQSAFVLGGEFRNEVQF